MRIEDALDDTNEYNSPVAVASTTPTKKAAASHSGDAEGGEVSVVLTDSGAGQEYEIDDQNTTLDYAKMKLSILFATDLAAFAVATRNPSIDAGKRDERRLMCYECFCQFSICHDACFAYSHSTFTFVRAFETCPNRCHFDCYNPDGPPKAEGEYKSLTTVPIVLPTPPV
ncbi:hypothetical protein BCR34DRAFT_616508 [Clohesyomyces aquaticus]|uniref:Uncharacterized protein n=1 Tax=Clohesyomyces aquaticus TaxID=1231657 RepID=A0A1Y1ZD11_9PLEO|nr:hypothetical protein BCR34DRAFT_616508 [Clohesyomyces aquaticus]